MSCASKEPVQQIVVRTVYNVPPLEFISFPRIEGDVIPLDAKGEEVTKNVTRIESVIVPYQWYKEIFEFKLSYENTKDLYMYYKTASEME